MKAYAGTDRGRRRQINQDAVYYSTYPVGNIPNLFLVADGMGGHQAGDFASRYTIDNLVRQVEEAEGNNPITILNEGIRQVNSLLIQKASEDTGLAGMGTTLVAALAGPDGCCVANVGDSRGYLLEEGAVRQVTVDHSLVQLLVDRGEITPDQARVHPRKSRITRALGVDSQVECDLGRLELRPGCRLLLCSDGLTNTMDDETLLRVSGRERSPEGLCQALLDLALERGAPDNVTVVLAQL